MRTAIAAAAKPLTQARRKLGTPEMQIEGRAIIGRSSRLKRTECRTPTFQITVGGCHRHTFVMSKHCRILRRAHGRHTAGVRQVSAPDDTKYAAMAFVDRSMAYARICTCLIYQPEQLLSGSFTPSETGRSCRASGNKD